VASAAADIFRQAARANFEDARRRGSTVHIPSGRHLIVSGDLHGNRPALTKLITYADLAINAENVLLLQEIIHGPEDPRTGYDRSCELMLRSARLKLAHGDGVVILLGNHDLAQVTGNEITKEGRGACKTFDEGVLHCFGDDGAEVLEAINEFCLSMPLAARTDGGVFLSHSLPSPDRMELAGVEILDRAYRDEDLRRGTPVYEWTWGRDQTDEQTDALAETLGVEFFVLGHRHVESGFEIITRRAVTLASDHDHGKVIEFDSDVTLTAETVLECVRPIAALAAG